MAVPKLRFPEFTDDWEQRKLSQIYSTIRNAFVGTATPYYVDDGHFYLESNNVKDGQINHNTEVFINDEFYKKQKGKWLHTGDLVMVQSGHVGHTAVIPPELDNTAAHALIMFQHPKQEIEPYFLNYELQTLSAKKKIADITTGNTIKHILASEMQEFVMDLPSILEQRRIAAFFRQIDNTITLHQRKLEDLRILKKSMLQKMFPSEGNSVPEVRFPEFTAAWEQRKLSNIADIVGGGTPSTSNPDYWDGDIDWYTPAEIGEQIFAYGSVRKITKEGLIHSSAKILPAHKTVLFTSRAGIGNMAILKRPAATNQGFQSLVCHDDIDPYFMFSMGDSIKAKAERVAAGSTFAEISGKKLGELEFMFPDTDEQKAIGAYFKNLDYLITLHQRKCDDLQKLKKALLQQMFC
jgi:type I restriction enzyme S subunit